MLKEIFEVSKEAPARSRYKVLASATQELGELAQEVEVAMGDSYKVRGKDGVIGEAVDVILCAADMIYVDNPFVTEEEIMDVVREKFKKVER